MAEKQLIVAVEVSAAMGPFWQTILSDYLEKIIGSFCGGDLTGQKPSPSNNVELSLVTFNSHGSYSACLVQRTGWTRDVDIFLQWLAAIPLLVVASMTLQLQKGKRNIQAADPIVDNVKNPHFLVLISENFMEARASLSLPGVANLSSNQSPVKADVASVTSAAGPAASVNGSILNRSQISVANVPTATVKVEPTTLTSMAPGPAFSHIPCASQFSSSSKFADIFTAYNYSRDDYRW
ncbi:hypothetical protein GH714_019971 [Hevea brasiliensis]|uniref:Mediator of RNA polymerase II transcription subunit 25 n=1 Tax=Hevea brasiliensis TaxID=3981 RepID=A0A6A6MG40_HEVBR|nr:hypothetical protein GH714_019971 [Hevea brasiliensis]